MKCINNAGDETPATRIMFGCLRNINNQLAHDFFSNRTAVFLIALQLNPDALTRVSKESPDASESIPFELSSFR
jgi:hypothetical protein